MTTAMMTADTMVERIAKLALGVPQVRLTPEEEKVISRAIDASKVLVKPDERGTIYLSHPAYTAWFNEAFGVAGWQCLPISEPHLANGEVVIEYAYYIHGVFVGCGVGDMDYNPEGAFERLGFGQAIEATHAAALRRFAKRIGMGLELWDKGWVREFLEMFAVQVAVTRRNDTKNAWRLKADPPLKGEQRGPERVEDAPPAGQAEPGRARQSAVGSRAPKPVEAPRTATRPVSEPARRQSAVGSRAKPATRTGSGGSSPATGRGKAVITASQRTRFYTLVTKAGRTEVDVKAWLLDAYGYESANDIAQGDYEDICEAVQSRKELKGKAYSQLAEEDRGGFGGQEPPPLTDEDIPFESRTRR